MTNLDCTKEHLFKWESGEIEYKEYIENRVLKQIEYYELKSTKNQKAYRILMILNTIAGALIPILSLLSDTSMTIKIIISALGASISLMVSITSLYNFRELWIQYRTNCEMLKSTLYLYNTRSGSFQNLPNEESFHLFVETCENYIIKESTSWQALKSQAHSNKS